MVKARLMLNAEVDLAEPVSEICSLIGVTLAYHRGSETQILNGIREEIEKSIARLENGNKLKEQEFRRR